MFRNFSHQSRTANIIYKRPFPGLFPVGDAPALDHENAMDSSSPRLDISKLVQRSSLKRVMTRVALSLIYALTFAGLHHVAASWATGHLYSLWFPGAGVRFAFLWWMGPSITPLAALAEFVVGVGSGEVVLAQQSFLEILGVVSPCLIYGLVVQLVQRHASKRLPLSLHDPLPFAIAALIGPIAACLSALPWAIPAAGAHGSLSLKVLVSALAVFTLGDMLGVLIVAPPLIWLARQFTAGRQWTVMIPHPQWTAQFLLLTAAAWSVVWVVQWAGLGLWLPPVLLATCWIGLRAGRPGAWCSTLLAALIVLPITASLPDPNQRLGLHMLLACIAAVGYLIGSFAEAEVRSHAEIARRDRLLFQAERLKTLRAMSVAVIHDLSQPLSTIAIEAEHLAVASTAAHRDWDEIAETATLIARKAEDLSRMVRRLRRFGDRAADAPSSNAVSMLLSDVVAIAAPEAKAVGVVIDVVPGSEVTVRGQDIELRQALLNLLRNAIAASSADGVVQISHVVRHGSVHLFIGNDAGGSASRRPGMGVGLLIARSIAEAHGGRIVEERSTANYIRFRLELPVGSADE